MSIYNIKGFTYGVELEIADVDTRVELPEGCIWDRKDYTIGNTCGVCNDPKKEFIIFGGEINTKPTKTVMEQVDLIADIYDRLGDRKSINHTCNLHIHVGVDGLRNDLEALKKLATYVFKYQKEAFSIVEDLIPPKREEFDTDEEYKGAKKRYNRRKISHQKQLSKKVYDKMMLATNIDEFFESFAPVGEDGTVYWGTVTRCGINFLQMYKETPTVEFRHFPMTFDKSEIYSSIMWCSLFMDAALNTGRSPKEIIADNYWMVFPEFAKYNHKIQQIMSLTSVGKHSRNQVKENIDNLINEGVISKTDLYGEI